MKHDDGETFPVEKGGCCAYRQRHRWVSGQNALLDGDSRGERQRKSTRCKDRKGKPMRQTVREAKTQTAGERTLSVAYGNLVISSWKSR